MLCAISKSMLTFSYSTRKTGLRKKPANAVKKNGIARGSWIASAIANGETAVMAVVDGEVEVAAAMSVIVPTTQVAQEIALGHVLRGALVDRMTFVEVQRLTVTSQQPATEDVPAPARQQVAHRVARAHLGDVRALETAPSRQTKTGLDATGIPTVEVDGTDVAHLPPDAVAQRTLHLSRGLARLHHVAASVIPALLLQNAHIDVVPGPGPQYAVTNAVTHRRKAGVVPSHLPKRRRSRALMIQRIDKPHAQQDRTATLAHQHAAPA